jgi:hypothetical protein
MHYDGHDPIASEPEEAVDAPLDAAESTWDPWLWALYLRELAAQAPDTLH